MGKDCEICYFGWKSGFSGTTTQMACGVIHLHCSYTEQWVQFFPNSEAVIRGTMASLDIVLYNVYLIQKRLLLAGSVVARIALWYDAIL